jgi:hydroxyethylthiazole kinase-like uncharacterized protein yjeF
MHETQVTRPMPSPAPAALLREPPHEPTWGDAVLTVAQMGRGDAWAMSHGHPGPVLMERAGQGVAQAIMQRWAPRPVLVLCGPGNNGGDGWVIARVLLQAGWPVTLATACPVSQLKGDALHHARLWPAEQPVKALPDLTDHELGEAGLVVDALFGAGLSRALDEPIWRLLSQVRALKVPVVAVDVPSGLQGDLARPFGTQPLPAPADLTVTFMAPKPAHLLMPGLEACGELVVVDICIPAQALPFLCASSSPSSAAEPPLAWRNSPALWQHAWQTPSRKAHKYTKGHALVFGGPRMLGAARMTARAAARVGAGLVTLAVPESVWPMMASTLMSAMAQGLDDRSDATLLQAWQDVLESHHWAAMAMGPGAMRGLPGADSRQTLQALVLSALAHVGPQGLVLDADALMAFEAEPQRLFDALWARHKAQPQAGGVVLTPHEGEFTRLFGLAPLASDGEPIDKLTRTRQAAQRCGAVVLHKGPDTAIATPDGQAAINANAPVWLATAGSGDVLTGFIAGLMAQGLSGFEAACAGAWVHAACARQFGPGLLAEDLPEQMPAVLRGLGW